MNLLKKLLMACALIAIAAPAQAQDITEAEARASAREPSIFFYPWVTMEVTRLQLTNAPAGKSAMGGPANHFTNIRAFPDVNMRAVVRPNFDTLYSSGWLDLTRGPVIVSA